LGSKAPFSTLCQPLPLYPDQRTSSDADHSGTTFAEVLKDPNTAFKVSYNDSRDDPKWYDMSLNEQETTQRMVAAAI